MTGKLRSEFEQRMLPHLGAAYSLARWLMRHPHDAEDALQEGILRAYRSFHGYNGGNAQAWLLAIIRNTCLTALERRRSEGKVIALSDAAQRVHAASAAALDHVPAPDALMIEEEDRRRVHAAIAALPLTFREVLVLREFHDLSYREIADIVGAPVGTVMSRLARARKRMTEALAEEATISGDGVKP